MTNGAGNLPERVEGIEQKLDALGASVDARFEQVDRRFDQVDAALLEQRAYTEFAYEKLDSKMDAGFSRLDQKMDAGFAEVGGRFGRLERKLDQIIDLHLPKAPPDGSDSEAR